MPCRAGHARLAARARLELADIFRAHGDRLPPLAGPQARAARAIVRCRTAALGGHVQECDHCGHREIAYNSCRNRHCPKCQRLEAARWLEAQQAHLLPTEYHHVVFTLSAVLHPLFLGNPQTGYRLLFAAVAETLGEVALRPQNLGATIGFSAVLHTWTQTLLYHPHVHCIVTGGGLSPDGTRWVSAHPGFLFPVRILARVFRGKLLRKLEQALAEGTLRTDAADPAALLRQAARPSWVVYSKPPFAGPEQVLRYLGRYTHRIAISNERLTAMHDGQVTFQWTDRAHGNARKLMTLEAVEFLRRFLLHVLPRGLVRIRHYGLLANGAKRARLARCRALLGGEPESPGSTPARPPDPEPWPALVERLTGRDVTLCPQCRRGHLIVKESVPPAEPLAGTRPTARSP